MNFAKLFALKEDGKWWKEEAELFEDEAARAAGAIDVEVEAAAVVEAGGLLASEVEVDVDVDVVGDFSADDLVVVSVTGADAGVDGVGLKKPSLGPVFSLGGTGALIGWC